MKPFWQALTFLTILPTPHLKWERGDLGRAGGYFPFVGLLIGLILSAIWWLSGQFFPPLVTAVLVVIGWAIITGGLHLDGLADCGDGLLAAVSSERRLEILKDSRIGAFGAITLILHLFLKVALVATLASPYSLWLAPVVARWLVLPTAKRPLARPSGMGADFAQTLTRRTLWFSVTLPAVLAAVWGWSAITAVFAALCITLMIWRAAQKRLGGITGDIFGLTIELSELAILLSLSAIG